MGARLETDKRGLRRLWFRVDGRRFSIRLGRLREREAKQVQERVDALLSCRESGLAQDGETRRWLGRLSDGFYGRLAATGLVEPRQKAQLGPFLAEYIAQRADVKPATKVILEQARRHLETFLGADRAIDTVTTADADGYKAWLIGRGCARSTVNKWIRYARHYFGVARRRKLIGENPFEHLTGAVVGDAARRCFIPADDVLKVIDQAPDAQWKLLIALARFGGLRIPSEALALTWGDVDWEHSRFTVRASKTEHHDGGGVRGVPIFAALRPYLLAAFEQAEPGTEYVITAYRNRAVNLRKRLCKYIQAAGLTPWEKPWQNMRASRATELADVFPSHVAAAWLGHSVKIADGFYRQVTDEHYARATGGAIVVQQRPAKSASEQSPRTGAADKTPIAAQKRPLPLTADSSKRRDWAMPDSNRHEPNHHNIPQEKDLGESGGPPEKAGGATSGAILPQEGPKELSGRLSVHQLAQALAGLSDDDRRRLLKMVGESEGAP